MFGGVAFLVDGNMAVAASGQGGLMVRVDPADTEALLSGPHVRPLEMRGREMQGWLRVDAAGVRTKRHLEPWVRRGSDTHARFRPSTDLQKAADEIIPVADTVIMRSDPEPAAT
jgi:hypothetical protein